MQIEPKNLPGSAFRTMESGRSHGVQQVLRTPSPAVKATHLRDFPDAARISTRPLRYNIQLNQQITSVQLADHYLAETESKLLQLRYPVRKPGVDSALLQLVEQRVALAGGTVDRQFTVSLQQSSQVKFYLPELENITSYPSAEILLFAIKGGRALTSVALPKDCSAQQALLCLNKGLGRFGIHALRDSKGQLMFSVDEADWESISQYFSVRGEGQRYSADAFTLLVPRAEPAREDMLRKTITEQTQRKSVDIQPVLEHISVQRNLLHQHYLQAARRIDELSTPSTGKALHEKARTTGQLLATGGQEFRRLTQALSSQANITASLVKNILA